MKFAVIGAHCAAKTTSAAYTLAYLKSHGIEDVMMRPETARICPYPINFQSDFKTNFWILSEAMRLELLLESRCTHMICDRSVVDQIVYATDAYNNDRISYDELQLLKKLAIDWLETKPYDYFYLMSPLPIVEDSVRPADKKWQYDIWNLFEELVYKESGGAFLARLTCIKDARVETRKLQVAADVYWRIKHVKGVKS